LSFSFSVILRSVILKGIFLVVILSATRPSATPRAV
jgi:hypothetical protein